ncbi:unnamed protein product [Vicia faba]|uniref:Uncharacterized protein n=1 Tax=Vicia faba TaxID=3906 RepID=A0AAV0ZEJ6_VICFA|nr:unnamed protein product [Vicia faba]
MILLSSFSTTPPSPPPTHLFRFTASPCTTVSYLFASTLFVLSRASVSDSSCLSSVCLQSATSVTRRRLLIVFVTTSSSSSSSHPISSQLLRLISVINNFSDACFILIGFNQHKKQINILEEEKESNATYLPENRPARIREDDDDKKTRECRLRLRVWCCCVMIVEG